ncbi:MAG: ribosome biogenesis GTPase Der, partial [Desulfobacteraceae bacterium 4572_35.1]
MAVVAIVGRPNVGKSTLFNYADVTRYDIPFTLIDTGGFEPVSEVRMLVQMREQSQLAMEEADLILFVMDTREGLTPADQEVAEMLRRVDKPVFYVISKVDGDRQEEDATEFYG